MRRKKDIKRAKGQGKIAQDPCSGSGKKTEISKDYKDVF